MLPSTLALSPRIFRLNFNIEAAVMVRSFIKTSFTALIFVLNFAAAVSAGELSDGVAAYNNGDYATAYRIFPPLARNGIADAQYNLGLMYDHGHGVPQNDAEAVKWYRSAADQGHITASYNLGVMYENGRGLPQDYVEARKWYRFAADRGDSSAQYNLGDLYANGNGVPKDYVSAYVWFKLAAAQGDKSATDNIDIIAGRMSAAEIRKAQQLAREWKPKAQ
jgi:TPR repeat protein